jgi:hypothetical protein
MMTRLVQLIVTVVVTMTVLVLLARFASVMGGVGSVELLVRMVPAVMVGIWAARAITL